VVVTRSNVNAVMIRCGDRLERLRKVAIEEGERIDQL
jgi:hypothetical protein